MLIYIELMQFYLIQLVIAVLFNAFIYCSFI